MNAFYCDQFVLPLPANHRFPMTKYSRLRETLLRDCVLPATALAVPEAATDGELLRVHARDYVKRVVEGRLSVAEIRRLGFPWSSELVERSRRSVGGTIAAARAALRDGVAVNLAGGTHHAFADRGEGFCVFNDVAVAARAMQAEYGVERVLVVDCDVHQGNGTAAIFERDWRVFTFSIHGANNYPFVKMRSDLDVPLPDGTGDEQYLDALVEALGRAVERSRPELAFYVAGADPFGGDRFGRLALTREGLRRRDRLVFDALRTGGIPVAVTMSGGYAPDVTDIVAIHAATVREAAAERRTRAAQRV